MLNGLVGHVLTGVVGGAILHAGVSAAPAIGRAARRLAVAAAAQGIVLSRQLQAMIEEARLTAEDILAEAREQVGEMAPPPTVVEEPSREEHGHRH
ncbi:MAG: DUF1490 family protein [Chloroflexi bacterium]|nr:DUF1490 family protein [Chloroflexota bacterium]